MEGWDHKVSATPDEMKDLVENSKRVVTAMGSYRISAPESEEKKVEFRRSIVVTGDLPKGTVLKAEHLDYKRPGTGIAPGMTDFVIGRTLKKDLKFDDILTLGDLV